ncbi:MAG: FAD-binding and (Fe-S)-binding domain-containing protein [Pseudomonadota bacterium]
MLTQPYQMFIDQIAGFIPAHRLLVDPLNTLAFGTDASFYRLIPKIVVKAADEQEVMGILSAANRWSVPVTFRAAGTSLSGQAVTDSVLVIAGSDWDNCEIHDGGARIRLQPGVIGAHANRALLPYGRKIGPDPASINAAMIGGIAANNASGMCCGTAENSYQTLAGVRLVLSDGSVLDTTSADSRRRYAQGHAAVLDRLSGLRRRVMADAPLADRIRQKYKIKNTTGYSLNALVDFDDPLDILAHLMIGSEGTLGFISEIEYHTVVEHPHKATALMVFPDIEIACAAAATLKRTPVAAVELMDRVALRSVENRPGMPSDLKTLTAGAAALLVETRAADPDQLATQIHEVSDAVTAAHRTERPVAFTTDAKTYTQQWNIRKGLFPAVGAVRPTGTTVIIEDVAFAIDRLPPATVALRRLMNAHGYADGIIFGHALEGNLHFVFPQDFHTAREIDGYGRFMDAVCDMVVKDFDGSLKAEHGTGRNMAPFVALEWGADAYGLMKEIKAILDPAGLLNPGVILNDRPNVHLENIKPMPATDPLVDRCVECGFCEATCPSKDLTLSPRQRIAVRREISRLDADGSDLVRRDALRAAYAYPGEQTCAADGLCAISCPVDINTGDLTKALRCRQMDGRPWLRAVSGLVAGHFKTVLTGVRVDLGIAHACHRAMGTLAMEKTATALRRLSGERLPQWNRFMPTPVIPRSGAAVARRTGEPVVYFPACVTRTMGPAADDPDSEPLPSVMVRLLERAGYRVRYPDNMADLCCGMPFESKGFKKEADAKIAELENALMEASGGGRLPIVCDTSPCLHRMRECFPKSLSLYEPVEFIHDFLLERLTLSKTPETVAVHVTCSAQKMGLGEKFRKVAEACVETVVVPERVGCCGFAGDRGFSHPELNASALTHLRDSVQPHCHSGYSNSRTCEIGLSLHSGLYYKSIVYLVERCSR